MRTLVFLMLMFPFAVPAATVINYDDGSTYTLENNERIYVEPHKKLFKKKQWSNGGMVFSVAKPNSKRDYVAQPQDDFQIGSHEWCKAYVPWSEGLTFDMISWQRACDTDNDGDYDEDDDGWSE